MSSLMHKIFGRARIRKIRDALALCIGILNELATEYFIETRNTERTAFVTILLQISANSPGRK